MNDQSLYAQRRSPCRYVFVNVLPDKQTDAGEGPDERHAVLAMVDGLGIVDISSASCEHESGHEGVEGELRGKSPACHCELIIRVAHHNACFTDHPREDSRLAADTDPIERIANHHIGREDLFESKGNLPGTPSNVTMLSELMTRLTGAVLIGLGARLAFERH